MITLCSRGAFYAKAILSGSVFRDGTKIVIVFFDTVKVHDLEILLAGLEALGEAACPLLSEHITSVAAICPASHKEPPEVQVGSD